MTSQNKPSYKRWASQFLTSKLLSSLSIVALGLGLIGASYLLFLQGLWIPVVPGILAFWGSAIAVKVYISRDVDSMRQMLSRYLTEVWTNR